MVFGDWLRICDCKHFTHQCGYCAVVPGNKCGHTTNQALTHCAFGAPKQHRIGVYKGHTARHRKRLSFEESQLNAKLAALKDWGIVS